MSDAYINIQNKTFPAHCESAVRVVIRNLEIRVSDREFLCLIGPSGCGKSTLLNLIAGIDRDYEGKIDLGTSGPRIGYVFQDPRLLPWRTVKQNILLGLPRGLSEKLNVSELLAELGIAECEKQYPGQLSLGMQRRVALARAFALKPDILLMDEPFVSLDEPNASRLRDLLVATWRHHRTTVIFVTHDIREALQVGDRILVLQGPPATIVREVRLDEPRAERSTDKLAHLHREIHTMISHCH